MMDPTNPLFEAEDLERSNIQLVQGQSQAALDGVASPGNFWITGIDEKLTIGDKPGFRFTVLGYRKDRVKRMKDEEDQNRVVCVGSMNEQKNWQGQLVVDPEYDLYEKARQTIGLPIDNMQCLQCPLAADIHRRKNPMSAYSRAGTEWKDACKFRVTIACEITAGLPEGIDPPPVSFFYLQPLPGRNAMGRLATNLASHAGITPDKGLWVRQYEAYSLTETAGSNRFWAWRVKSVGRTPQEDIDRLREMAGFAKDLLTYTPSEPQIEGAKDVSAEEDPLLSDEMLK